MEPDFNELAEIGMGFTLPSINGRRANKQEIKKLREDINDNIIKNEEKMISIVVKPDPDYINPDSTGNGISESMENFEFSVEDDIINSYVDDKYRKDIVQIINMTNNYITSCQEQLNKIDSTLDINDKEIINSIFNKVVKNLKSSINTHYVYKTTGDKIIVISEICSKLYEALNILNLEKFDTYIKFFSIFNPTWLLTTETLSYLKDERDISNFFNSLNMYSVDYTKTKIESSAGLIRNEKDIPLISVISNPDNILGNWKYCNHTICKSLTTIKLKPGMNIPNAEYACILVKFIYTIFSAFFSVVLAISEDIQSIIERIEPSKSTIRIENCLISDIESKNPWVCADYHLLKEYKHGSTDTTRTMDIIKMHNSSIKPGDLVLFEGDITESEYFDQNIVKYIKEVSALVKRLNGHKIMIIGNNDTGPKEIYYKMGFEEVYERPILGKKILFSHEPQIMTNYPGILNIHGHIHGSKKYWDMDYKNHLDCYYGLYGKSMKLSDLISYYKAGKYNDLEGNIKGEWRDPRIEIPPIKL